VGRKKCSEANAEPLVWDRSFSVGVPIFDSQHQVLFKIINDLQDACVTDASQADFLRIIHELYDYSTSHFRDEEAILTRKQSPQLSAQQMQHAVFLDYVIDLEAKVKSNSGTINEEILTFLKVWWEEHVLKIDKQYSILF